MISIRFGYCPPNPGWKTKKRWYWFTDYKSAIEFAYDNNRFNNIWVSYNKLPYKELTFDKLCELYEKEKFDKSNGRND